MANYVSPNTCNAKSIPITVHILGQEPGTLFYNIAHVLATPIATVGNIQKNLTETKHRPLDKYMYNQIVVYANVY